MDDETIAALSTPLGRGGIAVLRISGPRALEILKKIFEKLPVPIRPRRSYHGFVVSGGKRIDEGVVTYFVNPHSYTGEDVVEISIHSNPFIIEEVLNQIFLNGARCALPGEFTYRAYKNGKIDLIQAEAVNELIKANSRDFAAMKFDNVEGILSGRIGELRGCLVDLAVRVETIIEFAEDQLISDVSFTAALREAAGIVGHILDHTALNEVLDRGMEVVILGKVNVGKSSLFNLLLDEDRAIISKYPGTTRDYIKERMYLDGFPFDVFDVAGINKGTADEIENLGIKRGIQRLESCDGAVFILDGSKDLDENDREIYNRIRGKKKIVVVNKMDIADREAIAAIASSFVEETVHAISVKEHTNMEVIYSFFRELKQSVSETNYQYLINQRQKNLLVEIRNILGNVSRMVDGGESTLQSRAEVVAEEVRQALNAVGRLTGEVSTEEILEGIFSGFCIGK